MMIEMQYNFPLLPEQGAEWKTRLGAAVEGLQPDNADELRPTFRMQRLEQRGIAAKFLGSRVEETWITCGGHHGTLIALMAAGLAGKTIAVDEVTYGGVLDQGKMLGCKIVGVGFDEQGMRADSLREVCRYEKVSAIFTMPTVHNPLGCVAGLERREEIVAVAREFELLVIEDDAYGYMEAEAPASYRVLAPDRTFYVRGLSKSYAPAVMTGFLVAPERFTGEIERAVKNTTTGTSIVHNAAALGLVKDGTLERVSEKKRVEGARRNAAARALLGDTAAPGAECAWLLWVRLPEGMSAEAAEAACLERGVLVTGGNWFAAPGVVARGLRIGLGGEVEFERMIRGVEVVAEVVGASGRSGRAF